MAGKEQIMEELGDMLLPNLVNQALVANDRAKYRMTLLQAARLHADHPDGSVTNLKQERLACGVTDSGFDAVVERSRKEDAGAYRIPEVGRICDGIMEDLRAMLAPVESALGSLEGDGERAAEYRRRLDALSGAAPSPNDNLIAGTSIDRITSAQPETGDSFHLLVMNLHKELNRLQKQIAAESIDGASVYGITEADRVLVAAFMRGLNRTRRLKFDHPGLGTTATRTDDRLVIQNDIGTTDAHVLVIHIAQSEVAVTYTDVHLQRLLFFQNMLNRFPVRWEDTLSRRAAKLTETLYHLSAGRFTADGEAQLADYLDFLGSRIVFLIDWNRARKRLRKLAPKRVGLEVLRWAAEQDFGHMAFLKVGGEQLVFDALQLASRGPSQIVGQLSDIIGPDSAAEFLKFSLKTAAEGLLGGHSELLIRDQVRAELSHYLETAHQGFLELATEHAALIVELATVARDCLLQNSVADSDFLPRTARRARNWEHRADELVTRARTTRGERVESNAVADLLQIADDAADELEEGISLLTLLVQPSGGGSESLTGESRDVLQDLSGLLVQAAQEYLKAVENARHIHRGSPREDVEDFLQAVDNTISLEHQTDDTHRRAKESILRFPGDFKHLYLFASISDNLESAADAMMRAALKLKDYILGEVVTR